MFFPREQKSIAGAMHLSFSLSKQYSSSSSSASSKLPQQSAFANTANPRKVKRDAHKGNASAKQAWVKLQPNSISFTEHLSRYSEFELEGWPFDKDEDESDFPTRDDAFAFLDTMVKRHDKVSEVLFDAENLSEDSDAEWLVPVDVLEPAGIDEVSESEDKELDASFSFFSISKANTQLEGCVTIQTVIEHICTPLPRCAYDPEVYNAQEVSTWTEQERDMVIEMEEAMAELRMCEGLILKQKSEPKYLALDVEVGGRVVKMSSLAERRMMKRMRKV